MAEWCISVHTLVKINMLLTDQNTEKNKNMLLNCDQVKHNLEELSLILKLFVMFDLWMKRYSQKWPEFEYQIAPK